MYLNNIFKKFYKKLRLWFTIQIFKKIKWKAHREAPQSVQLKDASDVRCISAVPDPLLGVSNLLNFDLINSGEIFRDRVSFPDSFGGSEISPVQRVTVTVFIRGTGSFVGTFYIVRESSGFNHRKSYRKSFKAKLSFYYIW